MPVGDALERFCIGKIDPLEPKTVAELRARPVEPGLLQLRVVIIVEVVDPDDIVAAALEQCPRGRRTDETCATRDQNSHGRGHRGCSPLLKSPRGVSS